MSRRSIYSRDYELMLTMLRAARKDSVTQAELAKRLGMTQSAVSKCERGETRMDVVQLRSWCKAIGQSFPAFISEYDKRAG